MLDESQKNENVVLGAKRATVHSVPERISVSTTGCKYW